MVSLNKMNLEERSKAIVDIGLGKGKLANDFVKAMNLTPIDFLELQASLNSTSTKLTNLENAKKQATTIAVLSDQVQKALKNPDGSISPDTAEDINKLVLVNPALAQRMLNREEINAERTTKETQLNTLANLKIDDIKEIIPSLSPALQAEADIIIQKAFDPNNNFTPQQQFNYINGAFDKLTTRYNSIAKTAAETKPLIDAINDWTKSNGDKTYRLKQNPKNADHLSAIVIQQASNLELGSDSYEEHPELINLAIQNTTATGIIPSDLAAYIKNSADPTSLEGVTKAAYVVSRLRKEAPQAYADNLDNAIGGDLAQDLTNFSERDAGLVDGGIHAESAMKRFLNNQIERSNFTYTNMLDDVAPNKSSRVEQEKVINEFFETAIKEVFDNDDYNQYDQTANFTSQFKSAAIKTFTSLISTNNMADEKTYNNLMQRAVKMQQGNGWEDSFMSTQPGGSGSDIEQFPPEVTMLDMRGQSAWAVSAIEKFANTSFYKDQKVSKVNKIDLKFGKNLYVKWVGNKTKKYIDSNGNERRSSSPMYAMYSVTNSMTSPVVDLKTGKSILIDSKELVRKRNVVVTKEFEAEYKKHREKEIEQFEKLKTKKERLNTGDAGSALKQRIIDLEKAASNR